MERDDRYLRMLDFDSRSKGHPGGVYFHPDEAGAYLPIHPFADEPEILVNLNLKPEDCRSVDAYWRVRNDVCFLQVWLSKDDSLGRNGLFACWSDHEAPMLNVVAVINSQTVTRDAFEAVMSQYLRLGIPADARFDCAIGNRLLKIEE